MAAAAGHGAVTHPKPRQAIDGRCVSRSCSRGAGTQLGDCVTALAKPSLGLAPRRRTTCSMTITPVQSPASHAQHGNSSPYRRPIARSYWRCACLPAFHHHRYAHPASKRQIASKVCRSYRTSRRSPSIASFPSPAPLGPEATAVRFVH